MRKGKKSLFDVLSDLLKIKNKYITYRSILFPLIFYQMFLKLD